MSNALQKRSWWGERPTWQKYAIVIGGTALVVAVGGAAAYAVATYGARITITTSAGDITAAIGKAALENGGRVV